MGQVYGTDLAKSSKKRTFKGNIPPLVHFWSLFRELHGNLRVFTPFLGKMDVFGVQLYANMVS